jgi:hypothetical protein
VIEDGGEAVHQAVGLIDQRLTHCGLTALRLHRARFRSIETNSLQMSTLDHSLK